MKKHFLIGLIPILILVAEQTQSFAQVTEGSGEFVIYYGEKENGTEVWSISKSEGKINLADRAEFIAGGEDFKVDLNLWMDTTFCALNLSMAGKAMGNPFQVKTQFVEGKAINQISGQTTARLGGIQDTTTEVPVHKDAVIMPNGVFYPYTFLVQRYDFQQGGTQEFFAYVVPQLEMTIKAEDKGKEMVKFATTSLELRKLFLNLGGMVGVYVWSNDAGEVVKLSVPMQGIDVFKEGYKPESAKPEVDTAKKLYSSEEITFKSGNLKLAGTVTVPQDGKKQHPAVLVISGSGPQDRDGKTPDLKFSVQYKALAHALSNSGILVLRFDERGVGKSEGDFGTASLSDLISDVKAGINYLRSRRDVDKTRICLIGHSEGAIIAPMIAEEDTTIKAIVLMAGTSTPLDQVILEQQDFVLNKANVSEEMKRQAIDQQKDFFAWVRGEKEWTEEQVKQLGKLANKKKWFLEHLQHDPLKTIEKVRCKVLILQGEKDRQVFEYHAKTLNQALDEAKNKNHTLQVLPELDHLFCRTEGEGDYAEYANTERPLDQEFLSFLTEWLKKEL